MCLNDEEEKILLEYAKDKGCTVYPNKYVPLYRNDDFQLINSKISCWCILINHRVILQKVPDGSHYYRSSILTTPEHNSYEYSRKSGTIPMEKYNCGVKLENMKKYIDHQLDRQIKLKQREIKKRMNKMEKDFE